jgi:hypothetical protein
LPQTCNPPATVSQVLRLQVCTTMPSSGNLFEPSWISFTSPILALIKLHSDCLLNDQVSRAPQNP